MEGYKSEQETLEAETERSREYYFREKTSSLLSQLPGSVPVILTKWLPGVDRSIISHQLIEDGRINEVVQNLEEFPEISPEEVYKIVDEWEREKKEADEKNKQEQVRVAEERKEDPSVVSEAYYSPDISIRPIIDNLEKIPGLDKKRVVDSVVKNGDFSKLRYSWGDREGLYYFSAETQQLIGQSLYEQGKYGDLVRNIEHFPNIDLQVLVQGVLDDFEDHSYFVFDNLFEKLNSDQQNLIIDQLVDLDEKGELYESPDMENNTSGKGFNLNLFPIEKIKDPQKAKKFLLYQIDKEIESSRDSSRALPFAFASSVKEFGVDPEVVIDKLIAAEHFNEAVGSIIEMGVDPAYVRDKLLNAPGELFLLEKPDLFTGVDWESLVERVLDRHKGTMGAEYLLKRLVTNIDFLPSVDRERVVLSSAQSSPEDLFGLLGVYKFLLEDLRSSVVDEIIKTGAIGEHFESITDKTDADLIDRFIDLGGFVKKSGYHQRKYEWLEKVKLNKDESKKISDKLLELGDISTLRKLVYGMEHLEPEAATALVDSGYSFLVVSFMGKVDEDGHQVVLNKILEKEEVEDLFQDGRIANFKKIDRGLAKEVFDKAMEGRVEKGATVRTAWTHFIEMNEAYDPPLDKIVSKTEELFGFSLPAYSAVKGIYDGELTDELRSLGVRDTEEAGVNQLVEATRKLKREFVDEDFDSVELLESNLRAGFFRKYIRYEDSQWGTHDNSKFVETVNVYKGLRERGDLRGLPDYQTSSEELNISRVDRENKDFEYSEQFLTRFKVLLDDVKSARESWRKNYEVEGENKPKKPFSEIVESLNGKIKGMVDSLERKLTNPELNPKAKDNIEKQIADLSEINLRDIKSFQDNFSLLSRFGELAGDLRQTMFTLAFAKHRYAREKNVQSISEASPQVEDITWVLDFIDHITNKETAKMYFTDKKAYKRFKTLINPLALNEELKRISNRDVIGTLPVKFIPTRGLLMEFSGHIGDACWASKYESIAEEFPNFSSVTMQANEGTKDERLIGSSLLIETNAADGTPLLVVRGLNPIENMINQSKVEDFYGKFTDYLKLMAEKGGRELAIVIDGHAGGSGTNRPVLFNHLTEAKKGYKQVTLASESDTTFNGYNIVDKTYLVS